MGSSDWTEEEARGKINAWYKKTRWPWYKRFWRTTVKATVKELQYKLAIRILKRLKIPLWAIEEDLQE